MKYCENCHDMEKCEMYGGCWNPPAKEKPLSPSDATACSPSSETPETQRKIKRICGNWNNAGDRVQEFVLADVARKLERERDEARAMARDMRNQLERDSRDRLIFPWENA